MERCPTSNLSPSYSADANPPFYQQRHMVSQSLNRVGGSRKRGRYRHRQRRFRICRSVAAGARLLRGLRSGRSNSFQELGVDEILGTPRRALVGDEVRKVDDA